MTFTHTCPTCRGVGMLSDHDYQRLLADRPGQVGHGHPDTARRAAHHPNNQVRFGTQRWRVLTTLALSDGLTAAQVAATIDLSRNQTATRLGELRQDGLVTYQRDPAGTIVTRPTSPNDQGQVQAITPLGRAALNHATAGTGHHVTPDGTLF